MWVGCCRNGDTVAMMPRPFANHASFESFSASPLTSRAVPGALGGQASTRTLINTPPTPTSLPLFVPWQMSFTDSLDDVLRVLHGSYLAAVNTVLDRCQPELDFFAKWVGCRVEGKRHSICAPL